MHILRDGIPDEHNDARAVSDRCRLISTTLGLIVQFFKVSRGRLECRVGGIPNQGRRNRVSIFHIDISIVADTIWGVRPSSHP